MVCKGINLIYYFTNTRYIFFKTKPVEPPDSHNSIISGHPPCLETMSDLTYVSYEQVTSRYFPQKNVL
jgi:hypothetical protein